MKICLAKCVKFNFCNTNVFFQIPEPLKYKPCFSKSELIAISLITFSDPVITSLTQDIFKVLAQTPGCLGPLESKLVPTLVSILEGGGAATAGPEKSAMSGLQPISLEILETVVRASGIGQQKNRLSDQMMNSAFPAVVRCTLNSDDSAIMQVGSHTLKLQKNDFG